MVKVIHGVRACLAVGAFCFAFQVPSMAQAGNLCSRGWHAEAEKTAELGLSLLHSNRAADRVRLWRLIELGEESPPGDVGGEMPSKWQGTWQDEQKAYEFLAAEAAARGVGWSLTPPRYGRSQLNVWFAAKLFDERRRLLGDKHPYLKQWLENQRAVFTRTSPALVDAARQYNGLAAELAADDFQYQVAALLFYADSFTTAVDSFRAIAAQPASRYRSIATYMAARSLVSAGRIEEALADISRIQSNPQLQDIHAASQQLLGVISWNGWWHDKSSPATQEAARRLLLSNAQTMRLPLAILQSDTSERAQYWQAVNDLQFFLRSDGSRSWLRGQFDEDWWLDGSRRNNAGEWAPAVASVAPQDDLIDWLQSTEQVRVLASGPWLAFWSSRADSSAFQAASDHVHRRAEESGRLSWLIADAMRAPGSRDISSAMYEISGKLRDCTASRAELLALGPLRYHVERAQAVGYRPYYRHIPRPSAIEQLGKLAPEARREAVRLMLPLAGSLSTFPALQTNNAELNWLLSTSLEEFIPVRGEYRRGDGQIAVLNMLPARVLLQLAGDEKLPEVFRATLIRTAWTRAYLLSDEAVLDPATELLAELNAGLSDMVEDYRGAWTEAGRKRAALRLLVRAPSMQVFIPSWSDMVVGYGHRSYREVKPGKWSWYLSSTESTKESLGLFWADDWNHNDGNWWCSPDIVRLQAKVERDFYNKPLALAYEDSWYSYYDPLAFVAYPLSLRQRLDDRRRDFLSTHPILKMVDWEELGKLSKVPAAPEYLTDEVVTWVKSASWIERWFHGDEMAEALALAIRATRLGCDRDGSNRKQSYAAYSLLHELFPETAAAEHTRYWYD